MPTQPLAGRGPSAGPCGPGGETACTCATPGFAERQDADVLASGAFGASQRQGRAGDGHAARRARREGRAAKACDADHGRAEQRELFEQAVSDARRVTVRVRGVPTERARVFGSVWLAWTLWRALRFDVVCEEVLGATRERWRGRRWLRSSSSRGCASRRANCTSPRIGTDAQRSTTCSTFLPRE